MIDNSFLNQILHLYTWIVVSLLISIIGAIGLFYEKKFHYKTRYYLFFLTALLMIIEIVNFALLEDEWIDFIQIFAIIIAVILTRRLYRMMTGRA